jgi:hypothetical protein
MHDRFHEVERCGIQRTQIETGVTSPVSVLRTKAVTRYFKDFTLTDAMSKKEKLTEKDGQSKG